MSTVSYDLYRLGWKSFEDLVACILKNVLGQTFQVFSEGADAGRDGAFIGTWVPHTNELMTGNFTVQCKHTSKVNSNLAASIVAAEIPKIKDLVAKGLCDNYLLITNCKISAISAHELEKSIQNVGVKCVKIYGEDWIETTISENPILRRLVPRLYGLGDLTQIVTHQAYRQAREVLDSLMPDLACFVPTNAYRKCAHALKEFGFVLLVGEPASGKTTIANLLALSAADEWNLQTLMLEGPEEFSALWNPDDPGQFLWVDDAFGSNQYDPGRVREWNQRLPKLKTAIHKGARVVFTSRDYIFNSAKKELKISGFELFEDSRVVIKVENLTELEKQMILYNHLKCGQQPVDFRGSVKPFLASAAATPKFLPEIARRFANPKFTKSLRLSEGGVRNFFDSPQRWLEDLLEGLSSADRAAIALVFISGGRLQIPIPETESILKAVTMLCSWLGDVKASLGALNESLLRKTKEKGNEYWEFRHPTIRDAFSTIVGKNPELIDIYLAGVSTDKMIREVVCGDIEIEGGDIHVPPAKFDTVLQRIHDLNQNLKKTKPPFFYFYFHPTVTFLANRCSAHFLYRYFTEFDDFSTLANGIHRLERYDDRLRILKRLQADGCLPEEYRKAAVEQICEISNRDYSVGFVEQNIVGSLLTTEEKKLQLSKLKSTVTHNGENIIDDICSNWEEDDDPDDSFDDLKTSLQFFEEEGQEDMEIISGLLCEIDAAISDLDEKRTPAATYDSLDTADSTSEDENMIANIFADIDE